MKKIILAVLSINLIVSCEVMSDILGDDNEKDGVEVGGKGNQEGRCAVQTTDGYIIAGFDSTETSGVDVLLVKISNKGNVSWKKRYGGAGSEYGRWIEKTSDGNFVVCGSSSSYSGNNDVYLLKTNSGGDTLWTRYLSLGSSESGYCVREENGGNLVILGNRGDDMTLVKTTSDGQLLWYKTFGGGDEDQGESMLINAAGEFILLGETHSYGLSKSDFFIVKTDADGNELWNRHYGGSGYNHGYSITAAADSGYFLSGTTHHDQFSEGRATFMQIQENGDTLWTRLHKSWDVNVRSVCLSGDGNYIFTGWEGELQKSVYLCKMKRDGEIIWKKSYKESYETSKGYALFKTSGGGYFITGSAESGSDGMDIKAIKTDSKGSSSW